MAVELALWLLVPPPAGTDWPRARSSREQIAIWRQTDDAGHIWIVGSYYHFSADWASVKALDISAGGGDPMYVVQGTK